jgi:ppGpp synthetase/RelA/SpoT-type nucleotidyltranferase
MFQKKLGASPELVEITARPLKTREAIVQKLVREKTRLNRMQDIAGARIVGPHLDVQEAIRKYLLAEFRRCNPVVAKDSRERGDSNGYRAVHLVIRLDGRSVEIQIRTRHQDVWANVVEQIDSVLKSDLKHGRGPADWLEWFQELSDELRKGDLGEPFVAPTSPIDRD